MFPLWDRLLVDHGGFCEVWGDEIAPAPFVHAGRRYALEFAPPERLGYGPNGEPRVVVTDAA
jgi:hypothetical protein